MVEEAILAEVLDLDRKKPTHRLAVDVGANVGDWTRFLSRRFGAVVAVEPDFRAFTQFQRIGVPQHSFILPVACGSSCRMDQYHIRDDSQQSSLLENHPIGGSDQRDVETLASVPIRVVTLDWIAETFASDTIDLVKIDVEGSEADVLAGITSDRFASTRFLIELHDRDAEVGRELQRLGRERIHIIRHPSPAAHPNHKWVYVP